jgi:hypothetical protein
VALYLSEFPLDLNHLELVGRLKCRCGYREVLAIPQTKRQMREGRER